MSQLDPNLVQLDLAECVRLIGLKTVQLNELDDRISDMIKRLESYLRTRRVERLATVKLDDGCDLAWSQAKNRGHWRFVVRDEDSVTELLYSSREERADVFTSGSMRRLLDRLEVLQ